MMTVTLELPTRLEQELAAEAARLLMPLEDYMLRVLDGGRIPVPPVLHTGADLIAYWEHEGLISPAPDDPPSPELARMIRDQVQNRDRT